MAFQFLINGVDYTDYFDRRSLTITEALQANGQTMQVLVYIPKGSTLSAPLGGQQVKFFKDSTLEYAGRIASVENVAPLNQHLNSYMLNCVDYTVDLDRILLQARFGPQKMGDIIRSVVAMTGQGFTANNVVDGPDVPEYEIKLETPSSVITRLAESAEHQWYVDYNRDVHFFYILDRPAPVPAIDLDTDTDTYFEASITEDWSQVKNVIYLTGGSAKSGTNYTQSWTGDGNTRFFPLAYEPWDVSTTSVLVGTAPQSIKLDSLSSMPGDGKSEANTAYLCVANWGLRFPDGSPAPPSGTNVSITYSYAYEPVVVVEDPDSIAAMAQRENAAGAPSDGRHMFKFSVPELRVADESIIWDYGQLLLRRYAYPIVTVKFSTWMQGWAAGQNFLITSAPDRRNINTRLFVKSVTKRILKSSDGEARFVYDVVATNSPFPG